MKLHTEQVFRATILLACAVELVVSVADLLSAERESWLGAAGPGRPLALLALQLSSGEAAARDVYLCLLVLSFALFALAFWYRTSNTAGPSTTGALLIAYQILAGALVHSDLLYLVAAELAFVLPSRHALIWLGALLLAYWLSTVPALLQIDPGAARCSVPGILPPTSVWLPLGWAREAAFQLFAFCVGHTASTQMRGRAALAALHAQLNSAQAQLEEAIRLSEQARITQRVHETLDHHLSALDSQLALAASHLTAPAKASVETAHRLAQRLMSDVQTVVAAERDVPPLDLPAALQALSAGLPKPRIELECDECAARISPAMAHTLFRVVQEAVTNAIRHADATWLRIHLSASADTLTLRIDNDGQGQPDAGTTSLGSGLHGMHDRVAAHAGTFVAGNHENGGFGIVATLPLGEHAC